MMISQYVDIGIFLSRALIMNNQQTGKEHQTKNSIYWYHTLHFRQDRSSWLHGLFILIPQFLLSKNFLQEVRRFFCV